MEKFDIAIVARIARLIIKYKENNLSDIETAELEAWRKRDSYNQATFEKLLNDEETGNDLLAMEKMLLPKHIHSIFSKAGIIKPVRSIKTIWYRVAAAAAVIIMSGAAIYFFQTKQFEKVVAVNRVGAGDALPGSNGAVLTLANGSTIILDSTQAGDIAVQGNIKIVKQNGQLVYIDTKTGQPIEGDNTVSTPRGRQFQLTLPDGTKVWLNAASSIKYPLSFAAKERRVEVKGEAYFEVAKNANSPFIANISNKAQVEVLGTHFNINAYPDKDNISTTLLEGSVKVSGDAAAAIKLQPGQQAQYNAGQQIRVVSHVDMDNIMAWKNGKFVFQNSNIRDILNDVARWYNVEIDCQDKIADQYTIDISKTVSLSQLLKYIEKSGGVRFKINNGTVLVSK